MGLLPESMSAANMYGVELDPVSGQIAKQLYQKNRIAVQGFEETSYRGTRKFALKGKVRCGNCRRSMVLMESGANDRVYCPHKKMTGKFAKCSDEMVSVSIIEGHVWYALKRVLYVLDAI